MRMEKNAKGFPLLSRLACLLLALFLALPAGIANAEGGFGLVTGDKVLFRKSPTGSDYWDYLNTGWVAKILGTELSGAYTWYKVETNIPTNMAQDFTGYIRADFFRVLSQAEEDAWMVNKPQPFVQGGGVPVPNPNPQLPAGSLPNQAVSGTLEITKSSTNLRREPAGLSLAQLDIGTQLPFFGEPVSAAGYYWAKVTDSKTGITGFVRSDCYVVKSGSSLPQTPSTQGGTIRITLGGTNLRLAPGGSVVAVLARGLILPFYGQPSAFGGYNWVYAFDQASGQYGYVRSDCYEFVTGAPTAGGSAPTQSTVAAMGSLTTTKGGVNLRNAPNGLTIAQLDRGLTMNYTSYTLAGGYTWYLVDSPKGQGYVRSDVVEASNAPAPAPGPSQPAGAIGYIITTKSEINLRKTASGSAPVLGRVGRSLVFALTAAPVSANGYNWYPIVSGGIAGFLRGDCARQLTTDEVTEYLAAGKLPGMAPPAGGTGPAGSNYVKTILTSVNVRVSPSLDARTLTQIPTAGAVFPYQTTVTSLGRNWYKITYNGQEAYLLGTTARVMTLQEVTDYLGTQTGGTPTTPVDPATLSTFAVTKMDKVLLRAGAGMGQKVLTTLFQTGTVVSLTGQTMSADNYNWYPVRAAGVQGYIRADMLRVLTKAEAAQYEQTTPPPAAGAPTTATYRTLRLGMTGDDVTRTQQELVRLGYLQAAFATGTYNSQTADAVRNYQRDNGLFIDGVAGPNTLHKMFNTVPEGTYNPNGESTVTVTLNPVEIVDWYAGDINSFWQKGETAIMTDVKTGISLRIKRWSGGFHVDGEPLTAADTAALCKVYGVRNSQEILEKNLYQRRPVWVTLKGRSFAASLYGVPHNYPQGDTIPGNDFNGQLCVHFRNSKLHTSGVVDKDHMQAIQDAYNAAPVKK